MLHVLIKIASPGNSNEYPEYMILWRTFENHPWIIIKYPPNLICSSGLANTDAELTMEVSDSLCFQWNW